jgi:hypothetical protein
MQVPGGARQGTAAGEFEQNALDDAVLIVFGFVGQAGDEAVNDEGEEKMLVVDVVQREHGAAIEQELGGKRLKSEVFKGDAQWGVSFCRKARCGGEEKAGRG